MIAATACEPDTALTTAGQSDPRKAESWTMADWQRWARQQNLGQPMQTGSWSMDDMRSARAAAPSMTAGTAAAATDPFPDPIEPKSAQPGDRSLAVFGKIFMRSSAAALVCSGTVITDPVHPGKSNLVWTASHCLHEGKGGKPMTDVAFVPAFDGAAPSEQQGRPFGAWNGISYIVSPQWTAEGGEQGGPVSQFDFGVLRVTPPSGARSLEETVGGSIPVRFDVARERLASMAVFGYPAAPPFDGRRLDLCNSPVGPARLSFDPARPTMLTIGCTMTGGSSGGGWIVRTPSGSRFLVSNTSIGPSPAQWLAGPALGDEAKQVFDFFDRQVQPS
ncbi:trypsin-like serine peptidase [Kitasatospora sp. NPDC057904]|uniref:trypsin-like serine peptidase n=1 Tax=unclassified Kitasatospora TaxID=2633591 RepID=UPI0036DC35DA